MKIRAFAFVCIASAAFSCKDTGTDCPPPAESPTFQNSRLTMWADRQNVGGESPLTISATCRPLFSGKGTIQLFLLGGGRTVFIDSPTRDTLGVGQDSQGTILPVTYVANQDVAVNWVARFHNPLADAAFDGWATMDSIVVDGRLVGIDSEEALHVAPTERPFRRVATSGDKLLFRYP